MLEFLIPRRPLSLQAKPPGLRRWKEFVRATAAAVWSDAPIVEKPIHLKLIYLCAQDPVDIDNIIKPIQDALDGLVYENDVNVTDVEAHRRSLSGEYEVLHLPVLLLQGLYSGNECVYVRVALANPTLEDIV